MLPMTSPARTRAPSFGTSLTKTPASIAGSLMKSATFTTAPLTTGSVGCAEGCCAAASRPSMATKIAVQISFVFIGDAEAFVSNRCFRFKLHYAEEDFGSDKVNDVVEPHVADWSLSAVNLCCRPRADFWVFDHPAEFLLIERNTNQHGVT